MDRPSRALTALLLLAVAAAAWAAAEPVTLSLTADEISGSLERDGAVDAVGNARIAYQDGSITADRIHLDRGQRVATATGNVEVKREGQVLTGRELMYDLASGEGHIYGARAEVHERTERGELVAFLMGEELAMGQDIAYIVKGRFTTCDRKHPHYLVSANEWRYVPGEAIEAHGAQVEVYGLKLPKVRKLKYGLGRGDKSKTSLVPSTGFSFVDGVYASVNPSIQPKGSPFVAGLDGRLSLTQGFRGRAYTGLETDNWTLEAAYAANEDSYNDVATGVVVDRLPEVAFRGRWGLGRRGTALHMDGGWGRFREFPGGLNTDRLHFEARVTDARRIGRNAYLQTGAGFRYSDYGTGQDFRVVSGRLRLSGDLGDNADGHLDYVRRFTSGTTPFEFDDVDIRQEIAGGLDWRVSKRWRVGTEMRYAIGRGRLRRASFEVGRVFHCIEYTLSYDDVLKDFGFGIAIPGL